jgi:predicted nucleic acid-binding protein
MSLSVVDASAVVAFLAFDDRRGQNVAGRLRSGDAFYAPTILDYEVLGALRGLAGKDDRLDDSYVEECIRDLELFPIRREDVAPLRRRIWGLRHNLTVYDAAYVALAEMLNATLVTCDEKFARSAGVSCRIETIT